MKSLVLGMVALFVSAYGLPNWIDAHSTETRSTTKDASVFTWAQVYCTADQDSHIATRSVALQKTAFAPPASPLYIGGGGAVTMTFFGGFEPDWGARDVEQNVNHPAPAVQWLTILTGKIFLKTSDGNSRVFRAGDVMHLEDTAPCRGHISHNMTSEAVFVQFAR